MANTEEYGSPSQSHGDGGSVKAVDAGLGWLGDVVVLVSGTIFAVALKLALQIHAGVSPLVAASIAGGAYALLAALHFALRPRSPRIAPAHRAQAPRQKHRPMSPDRTPEPAANVSAATPRQESTGFEPTHPQHAATEGFEHLQSLVAELARMTPGPKAVTPDPDAVQAATAAAWAQYASTRQGANAVTPQVVALNEAARTMALDTSAPVPVAKSEFAAELSDALAADRMTIYLEPIQQIESDRPRHYEVSVRFKDAAGVELPHQQILAAAREAGMLPRVDAAVLPRAARIAQHFQLRGRDTEILSRVHGASLPDQDFRSEVTAATIAADGAALVLSFEQSDVRTFGPIHWQILSTIADMGLRFAIESVTDLDMDFEALRQRGFCFAKLDAGVLLEGLPATGALIAPADVCRHFAMAGLALIVNHIDDEQALARILGFGVLFGQGALFGTKRAVRADILTAAAAA